MMNGLFNFLSYLCHPFLMPAYGLALMFYLPTEPVGMRKMDALFYFPAEYKKPLLVVLGVLTCVAPAISLMIMYWNRIISSLKMEHRKERIYPFILVTFYYVLAYVYVRIQIPDTATHPALLGALFGVLLVFIVAFIVNFYMKISLHAIGVFGLCGMLLGYNQTQLSVVGSQNFPNFEIILGLLILAGFVSAGRIYLKAHDLKETLAGMVLGFGVLFIVVRNGLFI
jgi:hypothetical protein